MRVKKAEICFLISYVLLSFSLFLGDVYSIGMIEVISKTVRLASYLFLFIQLVFFFDYKKLKLVNLGGIIIAGFIWLKTRDMYWLILWMMIFTAQDIPTMKLIRATKILIIVGTIFTVGCCAAGILPDIMTARNSNLRGTNVRHSFGFYHSNVLPLLSLYVKIFYIFDKSRRVSYYKLFAFAVFDVMLYILCNSRNSFILSMMLIAGTLAMKKFNLEEKIRKPLYICTKWTVPFLCAFSFSMMYLLLLGGIWNTVDTVCSGRFRLGIFKMRNVGLHILNLMPNEQFFKDKIVLDNGYIYVLLRYGVIILLFYLVLCVLLAKKNRQDPYALLALTAMFISNFIDNDLVDYSVLPFILYAYKSLKFKDLHEITEKFKIKTIRLEFEQ